jgi:Uma2 family endonuclease
MSTVRLVWRIPLVICGSTTLRLPERVGIESDSSYYIERAGAVAKKTRITIPEDPAPDIVLEIDITHGDTTNKDGVYAALGVREIWRHDGTMFQIRVWDGNRYVESDGSIALPALSVPDLSRCLEIGISYDPCRRPHG